MSFIRAAVRNCYHTSMQNMEDTKLFLSKQVLKDQTPSVQYLVFDSQQVIDQFSSGLARIYSKTPVNDSTSYHAFSVTKTFTALAVLQLAELHQIDLNAPVKQYLPDFPYLPEITIKQLLSHTSGIPNPIPLGWIHLATEHPQFDSRSFFDGIFAKNPRLRFPPGERFAYSNLGYVLLGRLIEKVSGLPYEEYINRNIIGRLELSPAELGFEISDPVNHASGYHKIMSLSYLLMGFFLDRKKYFDQREGKWKSFKSNYVNGAAYGGLIGTPRAFMKYVQELLKPDCCLLSEEYKKLLFSPVKTAAGRPTGMCLSWFEGKLNGHPYFSHAGGGGGYYCEIRLYPEAGIGSVIFYNRTGMKDERMLNRIDLHYLNS